MASRPKRKGQHEVRAILRLYSLEAAEQLKGLLKKPTEKNTSLNFLDADHFGLVEIVWRPRPSKNEWNTESDWRRTIARQMEGLYFDVLVVEYRWTPVEL